MKTIPAFSVTVLLVATVVFFSTTATATIPTFAVGQKVETNGGTNVRATADGTLLGTQQKGAVGTVAAGPVIVSGSQVTWYKVAFSISPSGWVGGDMLLALPASFPVGQGVVTNGITNVRATADGVLIGTQQKGAVGTITAGPVTVPGNQVTWYKVGFAISPSGWVGGDMLVAFSVPHQTLGAGLRPVIVADGRGVVDVAWENSNGGMGQFRRSVDGGATFGPRVPMTNPVLAGTGLQLGVDAQGAPSILWQQGNMFQPTTVVAHSVNGATWTSTVAIAGTLLLGAALVVEPAGGLEVASTAQNGALVVARSTDAGASWSTEIAWGARPTEDNFAQQVAGAAIGDGRVVWVWVRQDVSECDVLVTVGKVGGGWLPAAQVSTGFACAAAPVVEVDPAGRIDVLWASYGGTVNFAQSRDVGTTWLPPVTVRSVNLPGALGLSISGQRMTTLADGTIVAVWQEDTGQLDSNGAPATRVMESKSIDDGATWGAPRVLSQPTHAGFQGAFGPVVTADGSVSWQDDAQGAFSGDFRVYLNGMDVSGGPAKGTESLGMGLGTGGSRDLVWSDGQSVFYATVPH
jgi:hypothetical protein